MTVRDGKKSGALLASHEQADYGTSCTRGNPAGRPPAQFVNHFPWAGDEETRWGVAVYTAPRQKHQVHESVSPGMCNDTRPRCDDILRMFIARQNVSPHFSSITCLSRMSTVSPIVDSRSHAIRHFRRPPPAATGRHSSAALLPAPPTVSHFYYRHSPW